MLSALLASLALLLGAAPVWAQSGTTLEGIVVRVVDGDTAQVRIGHRVEKGEEPGGRQAHAVNRELVEGQRVRLERDVQSRDRYGRLLAYVWRDGTMINAELVRLGYAQVMTVPPNVRYQDLFLKLQRDARLAGRGLWRAS